MRGVIVPPSELVVRRKFPLKGGFLIRGVSHLGGTCISLSLYIYIYICIKEVNVRAGQVMRTLYTKRFGHTEWVTSVSHCPDGRVLSAGLDSKLCLWNATGVACVELKGHVGSISRARTHASQNIAISSGYDRSLKVWDLQKKREIASCSGHDAPVMDFIWADDLVVSGDRGGTVRVWAIMYYVCMYVLLLLLILCYVH